jgi:hypothetical protein
LSAGALELAMAVPDTSYAALVGRGDITAESLLTSLGTSITALVWVF